MMIASIIELVGSSSSAPQRAPSTAPSPPRRGRRASSDERELRVLLVEDNPGDAALVRQWLARSGVAHRIWEHARVGEAVATLASLPFDVVLLDLTLPDARDLEGVKAVRGVAPEVPLVILTGRSDEGLARACVSAGAHDYLEKDRVDADSLRRSIALATARSDLARARARLFHADRLQTVGQLAAGVAHEVNNPLQFVSANVASAAEALDALCQEYAADEALAARLCGIRDALTDARQGAVRISSVVRSLSQFSRAKDSAPMPLDVSEVVEEACAMIGHRVRRCAELELELEPTPPITGRSSRLVQVLVNLLINAAQAIEQTDRRGRVLVTTRADDGHVEVVVSDDGVGMGAQTLRRIFDPFFTTKGPGEGTGLGLAVSHSIVAEHGGTLIPQSRLGEGTTFTLRFPVHPDAVSSAPEPDAAVNHAKPLHLRILVVDDEPLVLRSLARLLGAHELTLAAGGAEALERLASGAAFDAVICDLSMPGLGGRGLHERVRALDPALAERFVFVTGGTMTAEDRRFAQEHGALEKPVTRDMIYRRLAALGLTGRENGEGVERSD